MGGFQPCSRDWYIGLTSLNTTGVFSQIYIMIAANITVKSVF